MRTLLAALLVFSVACGDDDGGHQHHADASPTAIDATPVPDAAPATVFTKQYTFDRGKFAEPFMTLGTDTWASIQVTSAGGDAYWNIHYHDGDTVTLYENTTADETYGFVPPNDGQFYFLVGNQTVEGTLTVDVRIAIFGSGSVTE